jgi:hypothetical protein
MKENQDNFWILHPITFIKDVIRVKKELNKMGDIR